MAALGNDRTDGAFVFFHNSYLFPLSLSLYPSFIFLLANWGNDAYSERFEQIPYLMQNGEEQSGYTLPLPGISLRHSYFHYVPTREWLAELCVLLGVR
jgi:hypothetical protein